MPGGSSTCGSTSTYSVVTVSRLWISSWWVFHGIRPPKFVTSKTCSGILRGHRGSNSTEQIVPTDSILFSFPFTFYNIWHSTQKKLERRPHKGKEKVQVNPNARRRQRKRRTGRITRRWLGRLTARSTSSSGCAWHRGWNSRAARMTRRWLGTKRPVYKVHSCVFLTIT